MYEILNQLNERNNMLHPSVKNEVVQTNRLQEIARLRLHQDKFDEVLNFYVEQAASVFNLPVALVSIVLDDAQFFVSSYGIDGWLSAVSGTPVEWSFCANSVKTKKPFMVEDALINDTVKDSPLVTMDKIRCYAGVPLITQNNEVLGNLCVIGNQPRVFDKSEIYLLKKLADRVMQRLETRIR